MSWLLGLKGTHGGAERSQKVAIHVKGPDMEQNLQLILLAIIVAAGVPAAALAQGASMQLAQAQSAPSAQAEPCDPAAKPLSGCQSGVVRPPVTGDKGVIVPPEASRSMPMPVIPPPGSPGGDQSVQPK